MGSDDVSATSWVCAQLWHAFRWGLRPLATSGEELRDAKNVELGILVISIGDSLKGRDLEREMGVFAGASWKPQLNNSFRLILSDFMVILRFIHGVVCVDCPLHFITNIISFYDNITVC